MLNHDYAALNDLIVGSPHAISALKSVENPKRGSPDEGGVLLRHLMYKWFNLWVAAQMAFSNGQLSEAEFEIYKDDFRNIQDLYPGLTEELQHNPVAKNFAIFAPLSKQESNASRADA